jgi:glycosyltransferase involved in cell wall biosynthesis
MTLRMTFLQIKQNICKNPLIFGPKFVFILALPFLKVDKSGMISILMPIYNGIEFIEESISSILNQTYTSWELIIGINGHPPDSHVYQAAKEYEKRNNKVVVLDFFDIKGKANTLNEMIMTCKYEYVALLDVDDIWHTEKLQIQSQMLEQYDVIGSKCIWFGDRPGIIPSIPVGDISNFDFKLVNPIINSSALIKKNLCYWRKEWDGVEDYDLWLRLRKQKCKFYNFEEILVKHRIHQASAFNSKGNHNKVCELLKTFSL